MSPAPSRHTEIETKLEFAPGKSLKELLPDPKLKAAGVDGIEPAQVFGLDAVYFDTDRLDLLRAKLTLRRRVGGEDSGWHLKLPAAAGARTEVALPLADGDDQPLTVPAALADLVAGVARGKPLHPVARIVNSRTVRRLTAADGGRLVEVADDEVTATAIGEDGTESPPARWRELEAELLEGSPRQLEAVVTALRKRGATVASSESKLARALLETGVTPAVPAPAKRKDRSAGAAVLDSLRRLHAAWLVTDRALREHTPTSLHDARAATRRLRSVLGVHGALFDPGAVESLRERLAEHGRILGYARDLEVVQARLTAQLADEPPEYAGAALARLDAEFGRRIPIAAQEVTDRLRSSEYFALIRDLDEFLAAPPLTKRAARPAAPEVTALLAIAWRRYEDHVAAAAADPGSGDRVHLVRRRTKALRYATEAVAGVLGDEAVVFAAALEEIQEVLGECQDAMISADLLADLALSSLTDGAAGFVFGRLHAFEQATTHGCLDDFRDAWDRVADEDVVGFLSR